MSDVPGLPADVYFGGLDEPLPEWREETEDVDDPVAADEPDENTSALKSLYGYDPSWWEEVEETNPDAPDDVQFATVEDEPRTRRDRRTTHRATEAGTSLADEVRSRIDTLLSKKKS